MKYLTVISLLLLGVYSVNAQEVPRYTFNVGAGFSKPFGSTGRQVNQGWNLEASGGVNLHPFIGVLLQTQFTDFAVNHPTLVRLNVPDGRVHVFSATLNPVVHVIPRSPIDVYVIGGGGMYRQTQSFTLAPDTGSAPGIPFQPNVIASVSTTSVIKPGVNGGLGVSFPTKWTMKVYAEARYHRMLFGNGGYTDYMPVTFGVRW